MAKPASPAPLLALAIAHWACASAGAQVVINEVFENPPGRGVDETGWEFIELYGRPGFSLDGCMILVIKGGADDDRDGRPEIEPQIDEVFDLSGCALDKNGFFTLVGVRDNGESPIAERFFSPNPIFDSTRAESAQNTRWDSALTFTALTAPGEPSTTRLDNHGSSTYSLVYIAPDDQSRSLIRRGLNPDQDFDGEFDQPLLVSGAPRDWPRIQTLDEISWSNRGGREYTIWDEHEFSETPGLNPDALSRLAIYAANPARGSYTKDNIDSSGRVTGFRVLPTTIADESFLYGIIDTERFPAQLVYFDGFDVDGWPQLRGPTDRGAAPYGPLTRDPEPDHDPFPRPVRRETGGAIFLDDIRPVGFTLTPGAHNDSKANGISQQRLMRGDVNLDGVLDANDVQLAKALIGAAPDDLIADPSSQGGARYRWQGETLQQIFAALAIREEPMRRDDRISERDILALQELVGP